MRTSPKQAFLVPAVSRREFLRQAAVLSAISLNAKQFATDVPAPLQGVIDGHTHFFDPTRHQGIPWPPETDRFLHRPVLPEEHRDLAAPNGVIGTVVVEASAWLEDNQWLLDLPNRGSRWILGIVGRLEPGHDIFREQLARFARYPSFRGIRIGTARQKLNDSATIADLQRLIDADLSLDVNCDTAGLEDIAKLASALPNLRIMINHLANVRIDGRQPASGWKRALNAAARHENVHCKFSRLVEATDLVGAAPDDPEFYRPVVDVAWAAFGEDRLVYGSNWPVSARFASYGQVQSLAARSLVFRSAEAVSKVMTRNARCFYRLT